MKTNDKKLKIKIICPNFNLEDFGKFLSLVFGEKEISKMWKEAEIRAKKEDLR